MLFVLNVQDRATVGSDLDDANKFASLPLLTQHTPSTRSGRPRSDIGDGGLHQEYRPRSRRILAGSSTSIISSQYRNGENPFPGADFPLHVMTDTKPDDEEDEEERADIEVCKQGCVTPEDVARNFAERSPHFSDSLRSDLANRGSDRVKDHKRVDMWIMKQR